MVDDYTEIKFSKEVDVFLKTENPRFMQKLYNSIGMLSKEEEAMLGFDLSFMDYGKVTSVTEPIENICEKYGGKIVGDENKAKGIAGTNLCEEYISIFNVNGITVKNNLRKILERANLETILVFNEKYRNPEFIAELKIFFDKLA